MEDGKQRFEVVVLPQVLSGAALQLAHEGLGHNGSPRTYALLKRNYFWKGLKPWLKDMYNPAGSAKNITNNQLNTVSIILKQNLHL